MRFASVRELSQNPSKFVDLGEPVIITKHGRPVRALVPMDEGELEDFILAQHLGLEKDAERAVLFSRKGKNIPTARLRAKFHRRRLS